MSRLVGIVNLTPDSFSGDGVLQAEAAFQRIDGLMKDGADVIDIGAESTRPGAVPLTADEEWQRLKPVVEALGARKEKVAFSVDTRHVQNAIYALAAGFSWINDVSTAADPFMLNVIKESRCSYVLMHSLTVPADPKQTMEQGSDPVETVYRWAEEKLGMLARGGIDLSRVIFDPGIGFGKTAEQSLALIKNITRFKSLGVRLLVGHSRKSFLALLGGDRDVQTLVLSRELAGQGVDFLRVHDVQSHALLLKGMGS